jgi:3-dehydroquinate synthetase
MALAARFSARQGRNSPAAAERLIGVMAKLGLPVDAPNMTRSAGSKYMGRDKKNRDGRVTLILLDALGAASIVKDTPSGEISAFPVQRLVGWIRLLEPH